MFPRLGLEVEVAEVELRFMVNSSSNPTLILVIKCGGVRFDGVG